MRIRPNVWDLWTPLGDRPLETSAFPSLLKKGTHRWLTPYEEASYRSEGNVYRPEDVSYTINSEGMRCDELVPSDTDRYRVLFVGCSITFGSALPLEETFPYLVIEHLRKFCASPHIPYWNIAHPGKSMDYCIRNLYQFLPRLQPDLVVAFFPQKFRREMFIHDKPRKSLFDYIGNNYYVETPIPTEAQEFYRFAHNFAFFESLMTAYNCAYVWDSWIFDTDIPDDHLAVIPPATLDHRFIHERNIDYRLLPLARDLMHWGVRAHQEAAKAILNKAIPEIRLRY